MILGNSTKIPKKTITFLSHAQATPQNIIAGRHSAIYTRLWVDKGLKILKIQLELFLFTQVLSKLEIILEQRYVAFLSPSQIFAKI